MFENLLDFLPFLSSCEPLAQTSSVLGCNCDYVPLHLDYQDIYVEVSSSLSTVNGLWEAFGEARDVDVRAGRRVPVCTHQCVISAEISWMVYVAGVLSCSLIYGCVCFHPKFLPLHILSECSFIRIVTYSVHRWSSFAVLFHCANQLPCDHFCKGLGILLEKINTLWRA